MSKRMTEVSKKWSSTGINLDAAESEARRLEKKGTFAATMDEEAGTVTLSKDDFKSVMGKLGSHKRTAKTAKKNVLLLAFGYLAVTIGFIAVIVGLVNWRLEATKESHVVGTNMVDNDNHVVRTGDVESYAQLLDLPHFDMTTLNKLKDVIIELADGRSFGFTITRVEKSAGSTRLKMMDSNGNGLDIDSCANLAIAKIDGKYFPLKGMANMERRHLATTSAPALYSAEEYMALRTEQRALGVGSSSVGTATFALDHAMGMLDAAEGVHQPRDWESAYIESETMLLGGDMFLGLSHNQVLAERNDGELHYIVAADNGEWYLWIDTAIESIRHEKSDGTRAVCLPYVAQENGGVTRITEDGSMVTPEIRDCNEDGFVEMKTVDSFTVISRTLVVDFKTAALHSIREPNMALCMASMFSARDDELTLVNRTMDHMGRNYDPNEGLECEINMHETCEMPLGYQEAVAEGRNLDEVYDQLDRQVLGSEERSLRKGRWAPIMTGGTTLRTRLSAKGGKGGSNYDSLGNVGMKGATCEGVEGGVDPGGLNNYVKGDRKGDNEDWNLRNRFTKSARIGAMMVARKTGRARPTAFGRFLDEEERNLDDCQWGGNALPSVPMDVPSAAGWNTVYPGTGYSNFGWHSNSYFEMWDHAWLGHVMSCLHGSNQPSSCGSNSGIDGEERGPMWTAWAMCEYLNARGGYAYAFPVMAAMFAGTGGSTDQEGWQSALNWIADLLLVAIGSIYPSFFYGFDFNVNGGIFPKLHHMGAVIYVTLIYGCMDALLDTLTDTGGRVSFNVGHSLGGAATTVYTQSRPAYYRTVTFGAFPTCWDPGFMYALMGGYASDLIPEDVFEGPDYIDLEGDLQGLLNTALGELILYDCEAFTGYRYAAIWDPITGGGQVTMYLWDNFLHDINTVGGVNYNCGSAGNCFAAFLAVCMAQGILLNGVILGLNLIATAADWLCDSTVEFFTFGQADCDVPTIPYIDPFDYCDPMAYWQSYKQYSGGGLWNGLNGVVADILNFLVDCIPCNPGVVVNIATIGPFYLSTIDAVCDIFQFCFLHFTHWYSRGLSRTDPGPPPPPPPPPPPAPQAPNSSGGGGGGGGNKFGPSDQEEWCVSFWCTNDPGAATY